MEPIDGVLRQVIFLLATIFSISWLFHSAVLRRTPVYGALFALANVLVGSGVVLVSQRTGASSFLHFQLADWLVVCGFAAIWTGLRAASGRKSSHRFFWLAPLALVLLEVMGTVSLAPDPSSYTPRAIAFNVLCAAILAACIREVTVNFDEWALPKVYKATIAVSFLLAGLAFAVRGVQIVMLAATAAQPLRDFVSGYQAFLWVFVAEIVLVNISLVTLVVGQLVAEIRHLADRDGLTGVYTRRYAMDCLHRAVQRARRNGRPLACVLIDLDDFKSINDQYGHDGGDAALLHVCHIFGAKLRATDILGRFGGEEFILVCEDTNAETATEVAERLRRALESQPIALRDRSVSLTASFGISQLRAVDDVHALLKRADAALYRAKRAGRNRILVESMEDV